MDLKLYKSKIQSSKTIRITGSKSESNRLLLLKSLYSNIVLENLSNSDDTSLMQKAIASNDTLVDIHHAGTAMRFLTAYYATTTNQDVVITGSKRMQERPIAILVGALRDLGADVSYVNEDGFPPLKITPSKITKHKVTLKANVSSQYISALLLIAPSLPNGLKLILEGEITSVPYIKMTLSLLEELGVKTNFDNQIISIKPLTKSINIKTFTVESDWSSASYFYSIIALSDIGTTVTLKSYKSRSLQGDAVLANLYENFGVETTFFEHSIRLHKSTTKISTPINFNLSNAPDIAQTIAVTCFGLGVECHLSGLHTLKIKETDRLIALQSEIEKLGGEVNTTENTLHLKATKSVNESVEIETYNDHRMAMAFAPLALKTAIIIKDAAVVSKSYPDFWRDLESIGIKLREITAN
ncbi:3-phosphoshikimate 1-carboxyvinyltransferase [Ichthyenterobacterium sp. W332]|uniref:3-phosphoshikimate 1-carboxyvinyltransferase n=1 Tax=Microcosmobacter mediterraneus TaxID=3075607 RepID=A0ABU2YML3_9FLAO|nr:3-phosphoshikimate 1-carboxyvinyltransferase [Ichthyenterobacterium sp. W332]MDT0559035.1 3-phosphoshikimate 1-carboxyvinyltransferase [Ichthyenterobacterium sp. W332]